jgi:hypothetical protein
MRGQQLLTNIPAFGAYLDSAPGNTNWLGNRDAPDTVFAGYPANPKAGYPAGYPAEYGTWLDNYIFGQIPIK